MSSVPTLSLITPTGDRPEAFALCEKWVANQELLKAMNKKDWEWLIADDGVAPTNCTMGQVNVPVSINNGLVNTQFRNMQMLLQYAMGDYIIVIEDDDYYGPHHLAAIVHSLYSAELVGERPSRYYNVKRRTFREFENTQHASLCQTAFRKQAIPEVLAICQEEKWIDVRLWQSYTGSKKLYEAGNVIGIKGMPGRVGISSAHEGAGAYWQHDLGFARLPQWIGTDAFEYEKYANI